MAVGEIKVATIAKRKELSDYTDLVCPSCGATPSWKGGYDCSCGQHYSHWSKLKRVWKETVEAVVMAKLKTEKGATPAQLYRMDKEKFLQYVDAALEDYGVVPLDEASARNIKKLIIAIEKFKQVVILKFNDTYEERIAVLTRSLSDRIILREIQPANLVEVVETLRMSLDGITEQDIQQTEQFIQTIAVADEETLKAHDYRAKFAPVEAQATAKVLELEQILAKVPPAK